MDQNRPLVTIGMPAYNEERYIVEALDSLLAQTFTDFELIISDNASTDQTYAICQEYARKDSRVVYQRQPENVGARKNIQDLLKGAQSRYFMWAAADDVWDPKFLELLVHALEADPKSASAFVLFVKMDEDGNEISRHLTDYSGSNAVIRIAKFAYHHDDCCFYGLFRRDKIVDVQFPVWWGVNESTPLNTAYPMICYFLTVGNFCIIDDRPLFFKRTHKSSRWLSDVAAVAKKSISFAYYFAFVLRIINVFVFCLLWIYKASRSVLLTLAVTPILMLRYLYIIISQTFIAFAKVVLVKSRRFY